MQRCWHLEGTIRPRFPPFPFSGIDSPVTLLPPPETLARLPAWLVEHFPERLLIEDDAQRFSATRLLREVNSAAKALLAAGITPRERIAIWAPNSSRWVAAALAVHSVGAILVPLNTRYKGVEARELLERSRARLLFTVSGFLGVDYPVLLTQAAEFPSDLPPIILLGGTSLAPSRSWEEFMKSGDGRSDEEIQRIQDSISAEEISDILYTSGTTGLPKGVPTTHRQTLTVFHAWARLVGLNGHDRYLIVAPFFHCFGYKAGWLAALLAGATLLPQPTFDVSAVLKRIEAERITVLPGPPSLYQMLLAHPERSRFDLSSLRLAVTGAAVIPTDLIRRMRADLGFDSVLTGYGLTETSGVVSLCHPGDDDETVARTSGRPIPGVEVRIVDPDGKDLPSGHSGEILVRGSNVMEGYVDDPDANLDAFAEGGWLRTGDIGIQDANGYLSITDRKKDLFIVGGFNVSPAEVENMLLRHPDISRAAVIGVPDDRLGEVGYAFVVSRSGTLPDTSLVMAWIKERLANFKVPRYLDWVEDLPTNAAGKVMKPELRRMASTRRPGKEIS